MDKELRKIIQQRIRYCREEKGTTQKELGEHLGKAVSTVATWEQGVTIPDAPTLYEIAKYFGKSINYMYGEVD